MTYIVRPISDENCDSLGSTVIIETDSLAKAKSAAEGARYPYGAGIENTTTGEIDVGFGFGVPCPDFSEG